MTRHKKKSYLINKLPRKRSKSEKIESYLKQRQTYENTRSKNQQKEKNKHKKSKL